MKQKTGQKLLNCPNCGAPIIGSRCEYCGTSFIGTSYDSTNYWYPKNKVELQMHLQLMSLRDQLNAAYANMAQNIQTSILISQMEMYNNYDMVHKRPTFWS